MRRIISLVVVLSFPGCLDSSARIPRSAAHKALVDMLQHPNEETNFRPKWAESFLRDLKQDGATFADLSGENFVDVAAGDISKNEGWTIDLSAKRFRYHAGQSLFGGEFKWVHGTWTAEVTHIMAFCH